jgi:hypothetical protein
MPSGPVVFSATSSSASSLSEQPVRPVPFAQTPVGDVTIHAVHGRDFRDDGPLRSRSSSSSSAASPHPVMLEAPLVGPRTAVFASSASSEGADQRALNKALAASLLRVEATRNRELAALQHLFGLLDQIDSSPVMRLAMSTLAQNPDLYSHHHGGETWIDAQGGVMYRTQGGRIASLRLGLIPIEAEERFARPAGRDDEGAMLLPNGKSNHLPVQGSEGARKEAFLRHPPSAIRVNMLHLLDDIEEVATWGSACPDKFPRKVFQMPPCVPGPVSPPCDFWKT